MATPHVCPKCNGLKKILNLFVLGGSTASTVEMVDCPTCDGSGVVWQTTLADVCGSSSGLDYHAPQSVTAPGR